VSLFGTSGQHITQLLCNETAHVRFHVALPLSNMGRVVLVHDLDYEGLPLDHVEPDLPTG
jgi:hypothetical protein